MPVSKFSMQDWVSNGIDIGHTRGEVHFWILATLDTSLIERRLQFLLLLHVLQDRLALDGLDCLV